MCTERLAKMAERGLSVNVNELLKWASLTHGEINYMGSHLASLVGPTSAATTNQPNPARSDEKGQPGAVAKKN